MQQHEILIVPKEKLHFFKQALVGHIRDWAMFPSKAPIGPPSPPSPWLIRGWFWPSVVPLSYLTHNVIENSIILNVIIANGSSTTVLPV